LEENKIHWNLANEIWLRCRMWWVPKVSSERAFAWQHLRHGTGFQLTLNQPVILDHSRNS